MAEWKRWHQLPKRIWRGEGLDKPSARYRYILQSSHDRFMKREDAFILRPEHLAGEFGRFENVRIIDSPSAVV